MAEHWQEIYAPDTAGGNSTTFDVEGTPVIVRINTNELGDTGTVTLQYQDAYGNWLPVNDPVSGAAVIDGANDETMLKISAIGTYRVVVSATADDVGVEYCGTFRG